MRMNAIELALQDWLRALTHERKAAPNTVESYGRDVRQVLAYFGADVTNPADLLALKPSDLRLFMGERRNKGVGSRSLMRQLAGLRSFARHLEREGHGHASAFKAVRGPRVKKGLPRPLTPQDARATAAISTRAGEEREPWVLARDAAVFALLYGAGLARSRRASSSSRWRACAGRWACPKAPRRMPCAIPSRRICWRAAVTCAPFRSFSVTLRSRPPRSTRKWTRRA